MPDQPTYYEVLQVDPHASSEVIEAAYRSLAKKYHPDVNWQPDAASAMKRVNEAYQTLRDPGKRAAYDRWLFARGQPEPSEAPPRPQEPPPPPPPKRSPERISCQGCGRTDATLRATVFQYVISIVIFSFKRGGGAGVLCSSCRTQRAFFYTLACLLLGPWGVPWGVFWTLEAIGINLSGGKQPAEVNGPLLRSLAAYFLSVGKKTEAIASLEASLSFQSNAEAREVLEQLRHVKPQPSHGKRASQPSAASRSCAPLVAVSVAFLISLTGVAVACVLLLSLYGSSSYERQEVISTPQTNSVQVARSQPTATLVPTDPVPTAVPSDWSLVDDFQDNRNGWLEASGKAYLENGALHVKEPDEGYSFWVPCINCGSFSDFVYEADLTKIDGPGDSGFGLMLRATPDSFYTFQINSGGSFHFSKLVDSKWQVITPWMGTPAIIHGNAANRLRVVCSGTQFEFYVNDQLVGEAADSSFSSGSIGVGVGTNGLHIAVDNIRVGPIPKSATLVPAAPPPTASVTAAPTWLRLDRTPQKDKLFLFSNLPDRGPVTVYTLDVGGNYAPRGDISSAVWMPDSDRTPTILVSSNQWTWKEFRSTTDTLIYDQVGRLLTLTVVNGRVDEKVIAERSATRQEPDTASLSPLLSISDAIASPDGGHIAVRVREQDGNECPVIMNSDGTGSRKFPNCEADDHPRFWSVDGKWIVVWSERSTDLFAYEVNGDRRVPLKQLGPTPLYDERYYPWRVLNSPQCKSSMGFWGCE